MVTELEQLRKDGGWSLNQLKNKVKEMRTQERKSASATVRSNQNFFQRILKTYIL